MKSSSARPRDLGQAGPTTFGGAAAMPGPQDPRRTLRRAAVFGLALLGILVALRWVGAPVSGSNDGSVPAADAAPGQAPAWGQSPFGTPGAAVPRETPEPPAALATLGTLAPPAPTVVRAPSSPPRPVTAPALPFVYVGQWKEGHRVVVVLNHEGRSVVVRGPGPVSRHYVVQAIDESRLRFVYLPLDVVQVLPLVEGGGHGRRTSTTAPADSSSDAAENETPGPVATVPLWPRPATPAAAPDEEEATN